MKMTITIWQNSFDEEWNCDIQTCDGGEDTMAYWAMDDFCALLRLINERFEKAKFIPELQHDP
jgi:hypothetical protein